MVGSRYEPLWSWRRGPPRRSWWTRSPVQGTTVWTAAALNRRAIEIDVDPIPTPVDEAGTDATGIEAPLLNELRRFTAEGEKLLDALRVARASTITVTM
ncbi:MAG: hypothetical protein H0U67_14205 [Gemmatimonadetes bacterium]|nr:hypothetical protein [Gemmatimonadota bacterium]